MRSKYTEAARIYNSKFKYSRIMPNAWQDYTALIIAFYNRSCIIVSSLFASMNGGGRDRSG